MLNIIIMHVHGDSCDPYRKRDDYIIVSDFRMIL